MIVRTWHGIVPDDKAEAFNEYLKATGIKEAQDIPGNLGTYVYRQSQDNLTHFYMVSYWDSYEAIVTFAGPNPGVAVTYPKDAQYGLISDPIVLHHEVLEVPSQFPLL